MTRLSWEQNMTTPWDMFEEIFSQAYIYFLVPVFKANILICQLDCETAYKTGKLETYGAQFVNRVWLLNKYSFLFLLEQRKNLWRVLSCIFRFRGCIYGF